MRRKYKLLMLSVVIVIVTVASIGVIHTKDNVFAKGSNKEEYLLQELLVVSNLEKDNNINNMSIDGRDMAISLIKDIFGLYGLNIEFGMNGEIQKVNDELGNLIYQNVENIKVMKFQVFHLFIVVCVIFLFIILSILISRKSKIIVKGGDRNGFDEKKYA